MTNIENWKIEFENEFSGWWDYKALLTERIENFISTLLQSERTRIAEEVEKYSLNAPEGLTFREVSIVDRVKKDILSIIKQGK